MKLKMLREYASSCLSMFRKITLSNSKHCDMSFSFISVTSMVSTLPRSAQTIFTAWITCFGRRAVITALSVQPRMKHK
jgi:hypothetical protein